ncbi:hypothetical protein Zmor_017224 [Zophobas morio]|uniref:Uncharacterized protein n=1 Tax=Zophobas morio TaxID=2755281 RepID=A0AA38I8J7_9CUCU|nr:hypothetical protein Zmor_017224 [Zophobas morio]
MAAPATLNARMGIGTSRSCSFDVTRAGNLNAPVRSDSGGQGRIGRIFFFVCAKKGGCGSLGFIARSIDVRSHMESPPT